MQYYQPFASIRLERMSQAFGLSVEELEQRVCSRSSDRARSRRASTGRTRHVSVSRFACGEVLTSAYVRRTQILEAKETDQRAALFAKAIQSGQDMQAAKRKHLLRIRLCVYLLFQFGQERLGLTAFVRL